MVYVILGIIIVVLVGALFGLIFCQRVIHGLKGDKKLRDDMIAKLEQDKKQQEGTQQTT